MIIDKIHINSEIYTLLQRGVYMYVCMGVCMHALSWLPPLVDNSLV